MTEWERAAFAELPILRLSPLITFCMEAYSELYPINSRSDGQPKIADFFQVLNKCIKTSVTFYFYFLKNLLKICPSTIHFANIQMESIFWWKPASVIHFRTP